MNRGTVRRCLTLSATLAASSAHASDFTGLALMFAGVGLAFAVVVVAVTWVVLKNVGDPTTRTVVWSVVITAVAIPFTVHGGNGTSFLPFLFGLVSSAFGADPLYVAESARRAAVCLPAVTGTMLLLRDLATGPMRRWRAFLSLALVAVSVVVWTATIRPGDLAYERATIDSHRVTSLHDAVSFAPDWSDAYTFPGCGFESYLGDDQTKGSSTCVGGVPPYQEVAAQARAQFGHNGWTLVDERAIDGGRLLVFCHPAFRVGSGTEYEPYFTHRVKHELVYDEVKQQVVETSWASLDASVSLGRSTDVRCP